MRHGMVVASVIEAAVLTGCAGTRTATTTPGTQVTTHEECVSDAALPKELLTAGSVVLFGEMHGVKELPWFFGEAVCSTAKSSLPVAVGLEIPASDQASISAFLDSAGQSSDVEELLKSKFWSGEDGRPSEARVDLLQRLRHMRAAGLRVRVFPFDMIAGESAAERDKNMALKIAEQAHSHPNELTMVLVGDLHAWKTKGTPWDKDFVPMGWYLENSGARVYSLGRSTPEGTAWTCVMGQNSCGLGPAPAYHPLPSGRTSGIEMLPTPSWRGNDGQYAVSTLTASPPASQSHQQPK